MSADTPRVDLPWPSRRGVLGGAAAGAVALLAAPGLPAVAVPVGRGRARHLSRERLSTLAGVVDRVVPADDGRPGALAARCHEGIDALLGAFRSDPPRIYAGGPFSDRAGSEVNHFARFLPLDAYESRAWRRRVRRYQRTYARGLDALADSAPGFADLPGPARDLVLRSNQDPDVAAMLGLAVPHTFETCFGAPEYGGNRRTRGWQAIGFEGDRQPHGYTRREVVDPEREPLPLLEVGSALARFGPALTLATSEAALGLLASGGGDHDRLSDQVDSLLARHATVTRDLEARSTLFRERGGS